MGKKKTPGTSGHMRTVQSQQQETKAEKTPWTSPTGASRWCLVQFRFQKSGGIASGNLSSTIVSKSSFEIVDFPMTNMAILQPPPVVSSEDGINPLESHKSLQDPRYGDLLSMGFSRSNWEGPKSSMREMWPAVFFYGPTVGWRSMITFRTKMKNDFFQLRDWSRCVWMCLGLFRYV